MKKIFKIGIFCGIVGLLIFAGLKINSALQKPQVTEAETSQTTKRVYTQLKNLIKSNFLLTDLILTLF